MSSKQLNFFTTQEQPEQSVNCKDPEAWQLYIDGASRNNPGLAGVGFCLKKDSKVVCEQGFFVGRKTNNQAEYMALLAGVFFAKEFLKESDKLTVFSDSQLLVRQMSGQYRVKDAQLKKLQAIAYDILSGYTYSFCHIYREDNTRADELANRGIDKKTPFPKRFLDKLKLLDVM